ncbi:MAG: hypothetical protein IKU41_02710 [Clostridia bacterium]|nr:hypothetical protein [Clostridia bacterium]
MRKLLFYVFDEHTDYVSECQKIGMIPTKGYPYVENFLFDDVEYKVLSIHECYSGWEITLMALPEMSYNQLVCVLLNSKNYDELVGCLGIILKKYLERFIVDFDKFETSKRKFKKIKKIILNEISERSIYVSEMHTLLNKCSR